jgi:thymidylate synthase ThyX
MYKCSILADSLCGQNRLTTFLVTFPEIVHKQMLKHRALSINSRSFRALPTKTVIKDIEEDPYIPFYFGKNKPGMLSEEEVQDQESAKKYWLKAMNVCLEVARECEKAGIHKEIANRVLEPYSWTTQVITGTRFNGEYYNDKYVKGFFDLRCANDAQRDIQKIACMMNESYNAFIPKKLEVGQWHFAFIDEELEKGLTWQEKAKLCAARSARTSYLTHEGKRNLERDYELFYRLLKDEHSTALEHCATAVGDDKYYANFKGWKSLRYQIEREKLDIN